MPIFRVTSPDGATYEVNAPDGSTESDAINYIRNQQTKPPQQSQNVARDTFASVLEPVAAMATGTVAKPLSDVAGLAAIPLHAAGVINTDPITVKNSVQRGLTYEPRTEAGKNVLQYNPLALLSKGVDWLGGAAESGVNALPIPKEWQLYRQALGRGAHEAVNQAPGVLGAAAPKIAGSFADSVKGTARDWMQSALKPPIAAQRTGKSATAIDSMLENGINVSQGGLDKLRDLVDTKNNQIAAAIANSPATVSAQSVASRLNDTRARFQNQVSPQADLASINAISDNFLQHPSLQQPGLPGYTVYGDTLPVQTAQALKQGTYRALKDTAYGQVSGATIEAQKALARGLKEEIAQAVPQVRQLNAEESRLLPALPLVERRVLMSMNRNPMGLAWLASTPSKMLGFMADKSDLFKSLVARMLNEQATNTIPKMGLLAQPAGIISSQGSGLLNQ